jgi:hypothetical protein
MSESKQPSPYQEEFRELVASVVKVWLYKLEDWMPVDEQLDLPAGRRFNKRFTAYLNWLEPRLINQILRLIPEE